MSYLNTEITIDMMLNISEAAPAIESVRILYDNQPSEQTNAKRRVILGVMINSAIVPKIIAAVGKTLINESYVKKPATTYAKHER